LKKLNGLIQQDRDVKGFISEVNFPIFLFLGTIDQQIGEMDQLNSHVNSIEKEMLGLKKEFEYQVEQRNYTGFFFLFFICFNSILLGIQLIQRNDELCIHYEKLNIQDTVSKRFFFNYFFLILNTFFFRGISELSKKEDELKMLLAEV
jgi:hypothetical protein